MRTPLLLLFAASLLLPAPTEAAKPRSGSQGKPTKSAPARPASVSSSRARDPYIGAIVVEAGAGQVLFEQNADAPAYPASVIKLMDLLLLLERVDKGTLQLTDPVPVTAEAAGVGGTQVWLKQGEVFAVDDLLYALMVRSANDAATALALHAAGTQAAFVELMNQRARELGMNATRFYSVHGLPSSQHPRDVSTARDLAILAREVLKHPDALRYTSARERTFRPGPAVVQMRSHNHLLDSVEGCDGLKTGFFSEAGYSIVATAVRKGVRLVAVVLGSPTWERRDQRAQELLNRGFTCPLPPPAVSPPPPATNAPPAVATPPEVLEEPSFLQRFGIPLACLAAGMVVGLVFGYLLFRPRRSQDDF